MDNKIEFKKLREFGEVINDTFQFIKQNIKPLLKVFAYFCGFFLLATMIAAISQQISMYQNMLSPQQNPYAFFLRSFSWSGIILIIFYYLSYVALNVSILCFISLYVEKGKVAPTVEEVWSYLKYFFLRAMGGTFLISLFFMVCLICCIIPGIYVFPAVSLFLPVMIFENGSLSYSFSRSFKLLKDQWWITIATMAVLWIITYACTLFVSMPAMIINMASMVAQGGNVGPGVTSIIITNVIQYVCQVFMIIPLIGSSLVYFNLAERAGNTGLFDRINEMGETKPDFNKDEQY